MSTVHVPNTQQLETLHNDEIERCRQVFNRYEQALGRINLWKLRSALKDLEIEIMEEQLFQIFDGIKGDGSGTIDFDEFLRVIISQKRNNLAVTDMETVSAFVALGGNSDRSGKNL
jgi:Ca2+-binding EF-hand superfamily protein